MQRRDLLALIAAATGCALVGCSDFGAGGSGQANAVAFLPADIAFFDEVAETIIPRTATPGAKDARVGAFIATYAQACYEPRDLAVLRAGVGALDAASRKATGVGFLAASPAQRQAILTTIDRQARAQAARKKESDPPHYFTLMKQLTLLGFFTSEPGATKVSRYREIPGPYRGDFPYHGEGFWSWT